MLILTDDFPHGLNCDDVSHAVRDLRTGRAPRSPTQLAMDESKIVRMVRQWAASKSQRRIHGSTRIDAATIDSMVRKRLRATLATDSQRKEIAMTRSSSRLNISALLQRPAGQQGQSSEAALRRLYGLRPLSGHVRARHAYDAADPEVVAGALRKALEHLDAVEDGKAEPNFEQLREYLKNAKAGAPAEAAPHLRAALAHVNAVDDGQTAKLDTKRLRGHLEEAMGAAAEDGETTEAERERAFEEDGQQPPADDAMGETPALPVVTTSSRQIDHRRDFNDIEQGGADSAMGFDADALLQRARR